MTLITRLFAVWAVVFVEQFLTAKLGVPTGHALKAMLSATRLLCHSFLVWTWPAANPCCHLLSMVRAPARSPALSSVDPIRMSSSPGLWPITCWEHMRSSYWLQPAGAALWVLLTGGSC